MKLKLTGMNKDDIRRRVKAHKALLGLWNGQQLPQGFALLEEDSRICYGKEYIDVPFPT